MSQDSQINIKSAQEIAIMRIAGRINAEALAAAYEVIRPGASTADLNAAAEEILKKYGVFSPFKNYPGAYPYPASTCVSVNDELVHGIPSKKRKLKDGDIVSVDCGVVYEGYVGDSAFTAPVGKVAADIQKLLEVTERALYIGIEQMKAGNRVGDISAAIQLYVESNHLQVTQSYTGHGVGQRLHEGPRVPNYGFPGRGILLRQGMTIALEPMVLMRSQDTRITPDEWTVVSVDALPTAHFEHTIAISESGPVILTLLEDGKSPVYIQNSRQVDVQKV
jgi:methionyl aminopeptidase